MAEHHRGRRYLLLETRGFAAHPREQWPLTSYLRLGAVTDLGLVAEIPSMRARTPSAGGTTAATGAGEDLAAIVASFADDERHRCDPASLDDEEQAREHAQASAEVVVEQAKLEAEQRGLAAIELILRGVLDDPEGWLQDLHDRWSAAAARVARLEEEIAAAAEHSRAAQGADPPPRKPEPPSCCPGFVPKAVRRAESARLHDKGGWRDHTDGNRIITTRGDKVEVVRGNYRTVVLGRYDLPHDAEGDGIAPGWDVSGGHIDETSAVVAQQTDVQWKKRHNGTWHTLETTTKNDTRTETTGDNESIAYGHYRTSAVGSEQPTGSWHEPEDCPGGDCQVNPKVISKVWATEMHSETGSAEWPIPLLTDETWAKTMSSETRAENMADTTVAKTLASSTVVSGELSDKRTVATMRTRTDADAISDISTSATTLSVTLGDTEDATTGITTSVTLGTSSNLMLGLQSSLTVGLSADVSIGASADVFVGAKADISVGGSLEVQVGTVVEMSTAATVELALLTQTKLAPAVVLKGLNLMVG